MEGEGRGKEGRGGRRERKGCVMAVGGMNAPARLPATIKAWLVTNC